MLWSRLVIIACFKTWDFIWFSPLITEPRVYLIVDQNWGGGVNTNQSLLKPSRVPQGNMDLTSILSCPKNTLIVVTVHISNKYPITIFLTLLSFHSEFVWPPFFCETQKNVFTALSFTTQTFNDLNLSNSYKSMCILFQVFRCRVRATDQQFPW